MLNRNHVKINTVYFGPQHPAAPGVLLFEQFPLDIKLKGNITGQSMVSSRVNSIFGISKYSKKYNVYNSLTRFGGYRHFQFRTYSTGTTHNNALLKKGSSDYIKEKEPLLEGVTSILEVGRKASDNIRLLAREINFGLTEFVIFNEIAGTNACGAAVCLASPYIDEAHFKANIRQCLMTILVSRLASIRAFDLVVNNDNINQATKNKFGVYQATVVKALCEAEQMIKDTILPDINLESLPDSWRESYLNLNFTIQRLIYVLALISAACPRQKEEASLIRNATSIHWNVQSCFAFPVQPNFFLTKTQEAFKALNVSIKLISECKTLFKKEVNSHLDGIDFILEYLDQILDSTNFTINELNDAIEESIEAYSIKNIETAVELQPENQYENMKNSLIKDIKGHVKEAIETDNKYENIKEGILEDIKGFIKKESIHTENKYETMKKDIIENIKEFIKKDIMEDIKGCIKEGIAQHTLNLKYNALLESENTLKVNESALFELEHTLKAKEASLLELENTFTARESIVLELAHTLEAKESALFHLDSTLQAKEAFLVELENKLKATQSTLLESGNASKAKRASTLNPLPKVPFFSQEQVPVLKCSLSWLNKMLLPKPLAKKITSNGKFNFTWVDDATDIKEVRIKPFKPNKKFFKKIIILQSPFKNKLLKAPLFSQEQVPTLKCSLSWLNKMLLPKPLEKKITSNGKFNFTWVDDVTNIKEVRIKPFKPNKKFFKKIIILKPPVKKLSNAPFFSQELVPTLKCSLDSFYKKAFLHNTKSSASSIKKGGVGNKRKNKIKYAKLENSKPLSKFVSPTMKNPGSLFKNKRIPGSVELVYKDGHKEVYRDPMYHPPSLPWKPEYEFKEFTKYDPTLPPDDPRNILALINEKNRRLMEEDLFADLHHNITFDPLVEFKDVVSINGYPIYEGPLRKPALL